MKTRRRWAGGAGNGEEWKKNVSWRRRWGHEKQSKNKIPNQRKIQAHITISL
jgi:hypothetical protein